MRFIHRASYLGDLASVKRVIEGEDGNLSLNLLCDYGWTPLFYAAYRGHRDVVGYLVGKKAWVNFSDSSGSTPLLEACYEGHVGVVKLLTAQGANVSHQDSRGMTALFWASFHGHYTLVCLLLKHPRVDVDAATRVGDRALHMACEHGHVSVTRLLLDAGADPMRLDSGGRNAMTVSRLAGRIFCTELLEEWEHHYTLTRAHSVEKGVAYRGKRPVPCVRVVAPYKRAVNLGYRVEALVVNHLVKDIKPELFREMSTFMVDADSHTP